MRSLFNGKGDEVLTVLCLTGIAIVSMALLGPEGKEIAIAIGGGIVGYLKKAEAASHALPFEPQEPTS